jgi:FtsZ-binding cell division protein ZapB
MTRPEDSARRVEIYFGSAREKKEFVEWAKKAGSCLSPYIVSKLRDIRAVEARRKPTAMLMPREIDSLREENRTLREDLAALKQQVDSLQQSEDRERDMAHLDNEEDEVVYNAKLVELIVDKGPVHTTTILTLLGIEDDLQRCEGIAKQLESLEGHGLIRKGSRGWRWLKK